MRWVTFDCFGTLIDWHAGFASILRPLAGAATDALLEWVHVACSWYHDIVPARALGVKRVWLDRDGTGEDPSAASARVTSANDVAAAIARLG